MGPFSGIDTGYPLYSTDTPPPPPRYPRGMPEPKEAQRTVIVKDYRTSSVTERPVRNNGSNRLAANDPGVR